MRSTLIPCERQVKYLVTLARRAAVGISKLPVSTKMDEENVLFLDWLSKQGKPFPTSRSWWNNQCISLIRMMFRSGQIGVPISSLQGIPGVLVGIPRIPQFPASEPGLLPSPTQCPHQQARFSFRVSLLRHDAVGLGMAYKPTFLANRFRISFASARVA